MAPVARDEGAVVVDRSCGDKNIRVTYELTGAPKLASNLREAAENRAVERQDRDIVEKLPEPGFGSLRIAPEENSFVDLAVGNQADGDAIQAEPCEEPRRFLPASARRSRSGLSLTSSDCIRSGIALPPERMVRVVLL
jgi:hypothetical protein